MLAADNRATAHEIAHRNFCNCNEMKMVVEICKERHYDSGPIALILSACRGWAQIEAAVAEGIEPAEYEPF